MELRKSRVLRKLRADQPALMTKMNLFDPKIAEIVGLYGFDCVWIDMEHVGTDWNTVENIVRAAKVHDMDTIVRVAKGSYSDYIRPFELDATAIMIPHVMSAEEARKIAWTTKFHPIGRRPLDGGNIDGAFCTIDTKDYLEQANRERFVCIQIEDPEPIAELDAIASVPGIDMVFFGPGDYSHGIGFPGEMSRPEVLEARRLVAEAGKRHGKLCGTVGGLDNLRELLDLGYSFVNLGSDVGALTAHYRNVASKAKEILST